jgi:hypothetical protein
MMYASANEKAVSLNLHRYAVAKLAESLKVSPGGADCEVGLDTTFHHVINDPRMSK